MNCDNSVGLIRQLMLFLHHIIVNGTTLDVSNGSNSSIYNLLLYAGHNAGGIDVVALKYRRCIHSFHDRAVCLLPGSMLCLFAASA